MAKDKDLSELKSRIDELESELSAISAELGATISAKNDLEVAHSEALQKAEAAEAKVSELAHLQVASGNQEVLLLCHELCWLFARTSACNAQRRAFTSLPKLRAAIGTDLAERLERGWRGVT